MTTLRAWLRRPPQGVWRFVWAVPLVAVATVCALPLRGQVEVHNFSFLYLIIVVIAAAWLGTWPSLLASVLGVAAYNFFFVPPYHTFSVSDPGAYVTFAVMVVTSLVVGPMTGRIAAHARRAAQKEAEATALYTLTRGLSAAWDADAMLAEAQAAIAAPQGLEVRVWRADETPPEPERLAIEWVRGHAAPAGRDTEVMAGLAALYLPLHADAEALGVLSLTPLDVGRRFTAAERLQFDTFANLLAQALYRAQRAQATEALHIEAENEKLRNLLLSSLSHDLRTPLTAMAGGFSSLLRQRKKLPREAVDELTTLWSQHERLQRFVDNLLRMAAVTSGQLKLNRQPYMVQEIIGAALTRLQTQKGGRTLRTVVDGVIPLVSMDGALIEQVLVNLIENALRYAPEEGAITLTAALTGKAVAISVADTGPGLPPGDPARLFDRFESGADRTTGSGLGLAICRAIVKAHGGTIGAETLSEGGARFTFTLPVS